MQRLTRVIRNGNFYFCLSFFLTLVMFITFLPNEVLACSLQRTKNR